MKIAAAIAGVLLGLLFIFSSVVVLFKLMDAPPPPEGTAAAHFMAAFAPTGYLTLVKVCELIGGVLVLLPRTRAAGMLLLGPIIVNILAFHQLVMGDGILQPMHLGMTGLALLIVWVDRAKWKALVA